MDTTETYIRQCERAKKIQEAWEHHIGDWLIAKKEYRGTSNGGIIEVGDLCIVMNEWHDGGIELGVQARKESSGYSYMRKRDTIWLPRQDQLQEIVFEIVRWNPKRLFWRMADSVDALDPDGNASSPEQLWLAFVMAEKYGKVWDIQAQDWVTAKEG